MTYVIDAWLDNNQPLLRIFEKRTGLEVFHFDGAEVEGMIASGDLCLEDLFSVNNDVLEGVVRSLALYRCQ